MNNSTDQPLPLVAVGFAGFSIIALIFNVLLFFYILLHRLYHNFISSHFIAHLAITNMVALVLLVPPFILSVWSGSSLWGEHYYLCRLQALMTFCIWTVQTFMSLCIAGVHLLTFARIHYEQLFGLPPKMLCALSWLIGLAMCLPCVTNGHIVIYEPALRTCVWGTSDSGLKFLTYLIILGVFIPAALASYAYIRVLGILYHSPIVFQSIGLYKSRFLVYAFLANPLYQIPFYIVATLTSRENQLIALLAVFIAYTQCFVSPILYGASLFLMKEEDMAMTARAHKSNPYHHPTQTAAQAL